MNRNCKRQYISIVCIVLFLSASSIFADTYYKGFQSIHSGAGLSLHKEMFMLPVTISDEYDGHQIEAVFQISAKHRIFGSRFYFAYTQISFWQAYDHNNSAPFRETNYNPEIFYRLKPYTYNRGNIGADIGFEHESNGQKPPISRSWNLIYFSPYYYSSKLLINLKLRYRIPEDEKEYPGAFVGDDNPDITDYLGHSDLDLYYKLHRNHNVHLRLRGNLRTGNGGMILTYTLPIPKADKSYFIIRFSKGYGESLVDYKKSLTRIGFGILFGY